MEKEKSKSMMTIVIILIIMVLGLGGYIAYDKVLLKDNPTPVIGEKDYDLTKAQELVNKYYIGWNYKWVDVDTEEGRVLTTHLNIDSSNKKKMSCDELYKGNSYAKFDSEEKLYNVYFKTTEGDERFGMCPVDNNTTVNVISYDDFNKEYKKLFGSKNNAPKLNTDYNIIVFAYNEDKNLFVTLDANGGDTGIGNSLYKVKRAKTIGDKLIVKVSFLDVTDVTGDYSDNDDDTYSYKIGDIVIKEDKSVDIFSDSFKKTVFEKYPEEVETHEFTFRLDSGDYVLESYEK